nr:immunoglobulin light chain junction region [Macaca mulatta]MOX48208.1 immunoglobulin light chain junction region [Macaca mulatta]MOX48640.1 immunoglobulin light chain junction region [Macaca mulatta]MOX51397.1 immunoglobulin light chain junction region [Macaca mulatta]
CQQGYDTPYTF